MSIPLTKYTKIKNKYCIVYLGNCNEYLIQLKIIRKQIESIFPGLEIHLICKEQAYYLISEECNVLTQKDFNKENYAYIHELCCDTKIHPVEKILIDSKINISPIDNKNDSNSKICGIYPIGFVPSKSLNNNQIKKLELWVTSNNMIPVINPEIQSTGWVMGVENEWTAVAPLKNIKTTLINGGIGKNLYKKLYKNINFIDL